jgi:hypothetical protein
MTNPLSSEQAFEEFCRSYISCNGCRFFVGKKCTEKNHEAHDADKSFLVQDALNRHLQNHDEFSKYWAENINDYFICDQYESQK